MYKLYKRKKKSQEKEIMAIYKKKINANIARCVHPASEQRSLSDCRRCVTPKKNSTYRS